VLPRLFFASFLTAVTAWHAGFTQGSGAELFLLLNMRFPMAQSLSRPFAGLADRRIAPAPFLYLDRDIGRVARDLLLGGWMPGLDDSSELLRPAMNVSETSDELRISLDLPGADETNVDVTVDGDVLTIRATRSQEKRDDREDFHIVERHFGTFQRSLQLPFRVDPQAIQARFENGVLKLVVPKSRGANGPQKVAVQSGAAGGNSPAAEKSGSSEKGTQAA
jgi:HSP20 family protein